MAQGTIITAKGKKLDFAHLIQKSRRRIEPIGDPKDNSVIRQTPPPAQLNVRGHMPSHANIKAPTSTGADETPRPPRIETKSMVDYTGITIDEPKHLKERPKDPVATSNEALTEIMTDLAKYKNRDPNASKKA